MSLAGGDDPTRKKPGKSQRTSVPVPAPPGVRASPRRNRSTIIASLHPAAVRFPHPIATDVMELAGLIWSDTVPEEREATAAQWNLADALARWIFATETGLASEANGGIVVTPEMALETLGPPFDTDEGRVVAGKLAVNANATPPKLALFVFQNDPNATEAKRIFEMVRGCDLVTKKQKGDPRTVFEMMGGIEGEDCRTKTTQTGKLLRNIMAFPYVGDVTLGDYHKYRKECYDGLRLDELIKAANVTLKSIDEGGRVLVLGYANGEARDSIDLLRAGLLQIVKAVGPLEAMRETGSFGHFDNPESLKRLKNGALAIALESAFMTIIPGCRPKNAATFAADAIVGADGLRKECERVRSAIKDAKKDFRKLILEEWPEGVKFCDRVERGRETPSEAFRMAGTRQSESGKTMHVRFGGWFFRAMVASPWRVGFRAWLAKKGES